MDEEENFLYNQWEPMLSQSNSHSGSYEQLTQSQEEKKDMKVEEGLYGEKGQQGWSGTREGNGADEIKVQSVHLYDI